MKKKKVRYKEYEESSSESDDEDEDEDESDDSYDDILWVDPNHISGNQAEFDSGKRMKMEWHAPQLKA